MTEFLKLENYQTALYRFLTEIETLTDHEKVNIKNANGRVTSEDIKAIETTPSFNRSAVDGYAVVAGDTFGASETMPMFFKCIGEVLMGTEPKIFLQNGETALIHTGGMLPEKANAVVMKEFTDLIRTNEIEVRKAVSINENIILKGEDIEQGKVIINSGSLLGAIQIGACLAQGIEEVSVVREAKIGIISTGDELKPPEQRINPGQIREINSSILEIQLRTLGCNVQNYGIIPDNINKLRNAVRIAHLECDMVIITAGSSISERDNTAIAISELGRPGILVHGINIKPGKPTILAVCDGKPVIGLPGNPVSAFVVTNLIVIPAIQKLQGYRNKKLDVLEYAKLSINIPSQAGREDFVPVRLFLRDGDLFAEPVFYKSNLVFSLVRADALAVVPIDSNGVNVNEQIRIIRI